MPEIVCFNFPDSSSGGRYDFTDVRIGVLLKLCSKDTNIIGGRDTQPNLVPGSLDNFDANAESRNNDFFCGTS